ncbi:PRC-barrel domain-containing protein [Streptomyces sp. enrichment culture]|uniref:PRC-barrel domain-containing protein n=1 Tax=Streptomyces sp. enrichment culture TaxID=1795815 RepID=UPI003F578C10
MMLFTEVRGLPVVPPDGAGPLGTVTSLTVDVAAGSVSHLRWRGGRFGRESALAWDAVRSVGPGAVRVGSAAAGESAPPHHDLLGRRILTDTGTGLGTVLDVAFDTRTARLLALFTTRGELPPDRLLGLGDYALVVWAG